MPGMESEGTTLAIGDGADPEVFTTIGSVSGLSGVGGGSPSVLDVTTLGDSFRQKLLGVRDEGQITATLQWDGSDAQFQAIHSDRAAKTARNWELTFPDTTKFEFTAFVMTFEVSAEQDSEVTVSISLEISGEVTATWPV